ncbi:hypothetical protein KIH86_17560 [Paenibacillus sp. HN-1]|uniref:hypothetical protein n=1 Tax=Paenibacillus TaxID=44249 RepID=UPI001CAA1BB6|nr:MULTISPECIES: hypothetical protein [Paenibacillus]MBY9078326.1 hypothetical protein [Paenibacillus sp. CGMCC 1.18879]MBY9086017.1 hypothetical protein [Paenibacillus sinensis]
MNLKDITPGLRVRIATDHPSGHGSRTGRVVAVGTFEGSYTIGALIDIGEPLLTIIEPEALEPAPDEPLPPGWEEFDI